MHASLANFGIYIPFMVSDFSLLGARGIEKLYGIYIVGSFASACECRVREESLYRAGRGGGKG